MVERARVKGQSEWTFEESKGVDKEGATDG